MSTIHDYKINQRGFASIEFTVIIPFLLVFIFAISEFGRLIYEYTALNNTVRNANRYLMTNARLATGVVSITADVESAVTKLITYGDLTSSTELLPNLSSSNITISVDGDFVTLNVSYPWQPIFADTLPTFGLGNNIDISFPLVATYTMRAL